MPIHLARKALRTIGVDRAIAYAILGRGWSLFASPLTMYCIGTYLSPSSQGYYFTFFNVLGLTVLVEMGLSYVILQFASHEMVHLQWDAHGNLSGPPMPIARLATLMRMSLIWYSAVALLVLIFVLPAGLWFFGTSTQSDGPDWRFPWIWVATSTAITCALSPLFALFEGCGLVVQVARLRFVQQVFGNIVLWIALAARWNLYSSAMVNTTSLLFAFIWLLLFKKRLIRQLLFFPIPIPVLDWWNEVWPMQWKIALSWLSGWFIFQLFNPILFKFQGPSIAGQMGMSLALASAASPMAMAWLSTKAPQFGVLIAKRDFEQLDKVFFLALWQSLGLAVIASIIIFVAVLAVNFFNHPFHGRLLAPVPFLFLLLASVCNHIVFALAIYLRAHKQEPFLAISIASAIWMSSVGVVCGIIYGATALAISYFICTFVFGLGAGSWIFVKKRRAWHKDEIVFQHLHQGLSTPL